MLLFYGLPTLLMPQYASSGPTKYPSIPQHAVTGHSHAVWPWMWLWSTPAAIERNESRKNFEKCLFLNNSWCFTWANVCFETTVEVSLLSQWHSITMTVFSKKKNGQTKLICLILMYWLYIIQNACIQNVITCSFWNCLNCALNWRESSVKSSNPWARWNQVDISTKNFT